MTDDEVANKAFELAAEGGDEGRALFLILYITMEDKEAGPYLMEYVLPKMPRDDQTRIKFWIQEHKRAAQIGDVRTFVESKMRR